MPKLIEIDLTKMVDDHKHPDIKTDGTYYLVLHRDKYMAGKFNEQWYGLNLIGTMYPAGLQLDKPGLNRSGWQRVWEILDDGS